jgi:glucose-6-phosphate isomerase
LILFKHWYIINLDLHVWETVLCSQNKVKYGKGEQTAMPVILKESNAAPFISLPEFDQMADAVFKAHNALHTKTCAGEEFTGWVELPEEYDREEFSRITAAANKIREESDVFIVIGIGGSYLGARAAIEFLHSPLYNCRKGEVQIFFAGNSLDSSQIAALLDFCDGKRVSLNIISKSGTTTEPAVATRIFKEYMEKRYGKEQAAQRIYVTTDKNKGALLTVAKKEGYETFVVPDDIGGRYSVLTAVGLLPIAVAGADIQELMRGAQKAMNDTANAILSENSCYRYAIYRNLLYKNGKAVELFAGFEPRFAYFCEWLKQLFGESEGKDGKGLFPSSVIYTTDLHSLGQFVQDGSKILFETMLSASMPVNVIAMKETEDDSDGLNFLSGKTIDEINRQAQIGTTLAHVDAGVPVLEITVNSFNEYELGYLFYYFMKACAISAFILGVNPFDQPGVEQYKKNMFALLGKPGYEEEAKAIRKRI